LNLKNILFVLVAALALVGIGSIISAIYRGFYTLGRGAKGSGPEYIILPVAGHTEDIEFRIRGAMARSRMSGRRTSKIYLADFGADGETAAIAEKMCSEFEILEWADGSELAEKIRRDIDRQN
jgi:hypothetical protein